MPHGVDLLQCLERVRSAQNTEESTSCTLSTKIEPDTRGSSPGMTSAFCGARQEVLRTLIPYSIFKQPKTIRCRAVIPGWSQRVGALRRPMTRSGPDLRCAIAHRGILGFRVRCGACHRAALRADPLASPLNDGVCSNSKHTLAPRRAMRPSCAFIFRPKSEGVGNAGCPLHPRPRVRLVV